MTTSATSTRADFLSFLIVAPFVVLAAWNVWLPYSYWLDEVYTVYASLLPWPDFLRQILADTHPPFYQALLSIWMSCFGPSEPATRALSVLAAVGALVVLTRHARQRGTVFAIAAGGFFGSATTFAYYAQETRSYALMMLLATIATVLSLNGQATPQRPAFGRGIILLLLSLTHYFGLIYAAVLLLIDLVRVRSWSARVWTAAVGCSILIWPIAHVTRGNLINGASGLWFPYDGPLTTLTAFAAGVSEVVFNIFYKTSDIAGQPAAMAVGAAITAAIAIGLWRAIKEKDADAAYLASVVGLFLAVLLAVDAVLPISWPRNYVVLLPATSLLFASIYVAWAGMIDANWWKWTTAGALAAFLLFATAQSYREMTMRWQPQQNIRELIVTAGAEGLCQPQCVVVSGGGLHLLDAYAQVLGIPLSLADYDSAENATSASPNAPIVVWNDLGRMSELAGAHNGWRCWQPPQAWLNTAAIFLPPAETPTGLLPCSPFTD